MDKRLLSQVYLLNPWLEDRSIPVLQIEEYRPRLQSDAMLLPTWDKQWLILVGPRRAGKTTLGKYLSSQFIDSGRFEQLLYLNCDLLAVRQYLKDPLAVVELIKTLGLKNPVLFIDEVQRLENPGLLLKAIADLELPIKMIASGSSQLEIRSKVQEFLTGRQLAATILPLSCLELGHEFCWDDQALWGSYPQIVASTQKQMELAQIYENYIRKDIIEILKISKPDVLQKLLTLLAHSSGQLVNYNQLATDCQVTIKTIQNYLSILEQTYVISRIQPFVGNKRSEVTSNPVYYFIDNGFRNHALSNFTPVSGRQNSGLLLESLVFQEILKFKIQNFLNFDIHYWRTTSGAEVDFVLKQGIETIIPIEVKFQTLIKPAISRSYRSFLQAYQPPFGIIINKNQIGEVEFEGCKVHFLPIEDLPSLFDRLEILR